MKKDFHLTICIAAIAAALSAGATSAADLSSDKGPHASLPLWTGFQSGSTSGYSWVAADASSAYLYEVRADATYQNAVVRGVIDSDRATGAEAETRFAGPGGLPFPFGSFKAILVSDVSGAAPRDVALAHAGDAVTRELDRAAARASLENALLSATLQSNPFLSGDHAYATADGVGRLDPASRR